MSLSEDEAVLSGKTDAEWIVELVVECKWLHRRVMELERTKADRK